MGKSRFLLAMVLSGFSSLTADSVMADVKLPSIFGSGMVLQRELDVPVWGWADAGEDVTVSIRDQKVSVKADANGNWRVKLKPLALGEETTLTVAGKNKIELTNVLIGDVWVASGQSNMGWTVNASLDPDLEKKTSNYPEIRLFHVRLNSTRETQKDVVGEWKASGPETVGSFSAVAYFFGREIHNVTDVPIGLINTSWGGTRAEAWASPEMFAAHPEYKVIHEKWEEYFKTPKYIAEQAKHEKNLQDWEKLVAKAKEEGRNPPPRPAGSDQSQESRHYPSNLYNAMVAPIAGYGIRGAIWYQGESNASRAYQYRTLMADTIQSWRDAWAQGDFPFYQVQLANYQALTSEPGDSAWAELREAQIISSKALKNVDAVCITDIGATKDIHPKDKQNVGKRLARLALNDVYKEAGVIRQGPTFKDVKFDGAKAVVNLDTYGAKLITYYGDELTGFALAGEDKKWVWAKGTVDAKTGSVTITAPGVDKPVAVRYNWANNPQGNLYSDAYLPAYPFRSDDWEGITANNIAP